MYKLKDILIFSNRFRLVTTLIILGSLVAKNKLFTNHTLSFIKADCTDVITVWILMQTSQKCF